MKRKRRSVKSNTKKKPSVAAEAPVDPGFYSDVNKDSDDELLLVNKKTTPRETFTSKNARETSTSKNARETSTSKIISTKEKSTRKSGQCLDSNKAVVNSVAPGSASARLARALSSTRTNATADKAPVQRQTMGQKEPKSSHPAALNDKQELEAAETVIKKIMKMDAAMAFNAPVDPIALGIPDYYDVIKTPMDFGTICSSLERGLEYRNSEDVYKDVQLIWDNCTKYNKKGSYILELMKRVKANFMKQWTAAGLYKEQQTVSKEQQTVSKGDLPRYAQPPFAESARRHEDVHMSPVGSTLRDSAYLPPYNPPYMNQGQHHQQFPVPPYYGNTYNPHMPYQYPSSLHPGSYPQDMVKQHPQHGHFPHMPPVDPINANAYHPWAHQPSPSGMFNPQQRPYMHPSSSSQLPPSRLHPDINSQSAGHMHLPYREPTSTYNQHEHPYNLPQHGSDRTHPHPQHYQMDSAPPPPPYHHPSTSHAPVPLLNQSSYQQLHTSHVEGDRNVERSGNLTTPLPVESTEDGKTKCGTERPGPTLINNTSYHHPDKTNSMPEQSSSMNNMEACDVPEHSDKNEEESTPLERLHSTADSNISKRKSQVPEQPCIQEESSPNTNKEGHPPAENTPQNKIVPRLSQPLPLKYGSRTIGKKHRGRGPAKCMLEIERVKVNTDEYGDPTGPETQKLASFLGTLARNGDFLPLNYHDWRAVPLEYKESMWEKVQVAFDIDPRSKDWVLHCLSLRWKNWKSFLKTSRYDRHETDEERLADCDERVLPEQWAALVAMWGTEAAQRRSEKNRASRAKMKFNHTTGRKSFARIREEQKEKLDGKELSRAELFILTRTRKDGKPINAETSEVIEKLKEREQLQQDIPEENRKKPDDILTEIIGPSKSGGSRCAELGRSITDPVKPSRAEAIRMATQANTEIHEMKKKMAFMEQTCAQMASQMAAMMSMMSSMNKNLPNNEEVPDDVVPITGTTSNQSTPRQVNATPSPTPDATPQVPATSGTSNYSTPQQENIMSYPPLDTMPQGLAKSGTSDHSMLQQENTISSLIEPVLQQENPMSPLFDNSMPHQENTIPSPFEPIPQQENTMFPLMEPTPQVRRRGRPRKSRI